MGEKPETQMFQSKVITASMWRTAFRQFQTSSSPFKAALNSGRSMIKAPTSSRGYTSSASVSGLTSQQVIARAAVGVGAAVGVVAVCTMGEAATEKASQWEG